MDLLHIPGDTGGSWRLKKFGEFAHYVRVVDQLTLEEYHRRHQLDLDGMVRLFWLLSSTYSEITAIVMYHDILNNVGWENLSKDWVEEYWKQNKPQLQFGSARKYAKSLDWFPVLMADFLDFTQSQPAIWFQSLTHKNTPEKAYEKLYNFLMKRKFMGRFSTELFLMNFVYFHLDGISDVDIRDGFSFDWREYANETSGLLSIFYQDDLADQFDKTGRLDLETVAFLDRANEVTQRYLLQTYGEYDATPLVYMPRLCTFRNFCKKNRYAGFHHDRQLGFLLKYQQARGNTEVIQELFDIRKSIFPHCLLGELNGWTGIRPERKKLFVLTGNTGAELVSGGVVP